MDHIALWVGWTAIAASRLEHTIAIIVVARTGGRERVDDVMGRSWSRTYDDAKKLYRQLGTGQDGDMEAAASTFTVTLHRANAAMSERHHVLHSLWTANDDVATLDGVSTAYRLHGEQQERQWTFDDIRDLAFRMNDLHPSCPRRTGQNCCGARPLIMAVDSQRN